MNLGRQVTFRELFELHPTVSIPIVQRDYAQGRASESEVRNEFLNALRAALLKPAGDPTLPLDLDFVYGSVDSEAGFQPLDGQQRLTTLMLLHWYLAVKEGHLPTFVLKQGSDKRSRFTYTVRTSSMEFFSSLVHWQPTWGAGVPLSALLADQPWFFLSWTMDPTIQSALTMLDAIDARFGQSGGMYQRLVDTECPAITFQLLDLHSFGLSDDLYIKMNSRGKPLTAFEVFKAQLEHHVGTVLPDKRFQLNGGEVHVREYISNRIDTDWADVFWHYRNPVTKVFDDRFMNLVRAIVVVTRNPGNAGYDGLMRALREGSETFSFFRYQEAGCLDAPFVETLIALLDAWRGADSGIRELLPPDGAFSERAFVTRAMLDATRLSYADLVQFSAYCRFLTVHGALHLTALGEWMRLIVNLSTNTTYDRIDDFVRSMNSVRDLLPQALNIVAHAAEPGTELRGFNGQQANEERVKATLFLASSDWRDAILLAESHSYFAGQIEFLLAFAGVLDDWKSASGFPDPKARRKECLAAFLEYRDKAFAIFDSNGIRDFPNFLWERALLAHGDYLLPAGRNVSLLHNATSERDVSWKRLLRGGPSWDPILSKRAIVRAVFNRLDLGRDAATSLAAIVAEQSAGETWRDLLVRNPDALAYCQRRNLRRDGTHTYLLKKHRMSGDHAELTTYVLYLRMLPRQVELGIGWITYSSVSSADIQPFMIASFPGAAGRLGIRMTPAENGYTFVIRPYGADAVLPTGFIQQMGSLGFTARDEELVLATSIETAEQLMLDLPHQAKPWRFAA